MQNIGRDEYFEMRLPATSERVRMYGADDIAIRTVSRVIDNEGPLEHYQPQGTF